MTDLKQMAELRAKATGSRWSMHSHKSGTYFIHAGNKGEMGSFATIAQSFSVRERNVVNDFRFIVAAGNFDFAQAAAERAALEERVKRLDDVADMSEMYGRECVEEGMAAAQDFLTNTTHLNEGLRLHGLVEAILMAHHTQLHLTGYTILAPARTALENSND